MTLQLSTFRNFDGAGEGKSLNKMAKKQIRGRYINNDSRLHWSRGLGTGSHWNDRNVIS
jgi:hypothetical protein